MTAREIVKASLKLLGVLAQGETPTAEESADALAVLIRMLRTWSTQSLLIYATEIEEFTLVPSQSSYTVGPSANFNTTRPVRIVGATIKINSAEYGLDILTREQWGEIVLKDTQSNFPTKIYPEGTSPNETINFWPVPSEAITFLLTSEKEISSFANLNSSVSFPPGYDDAIIYNLALRLAPEYGVQPDVAIVAEALETKGNIKRINTKPLYLGVDPALRINRPFDILKGE